MSETGGALSPKGGSSTNMGSFLIRVPYYTGDLKRDPNLENYHIMEDALGASITAFGT